MPTTSRSGVLVMPDINLGEYVIYWIGLAVCVVGGVILGLVQWIRSK